EPSPHLPAPEDVEIYSYNFHSLLRWSPVPAETGPVLYTVHYKTGAFPVWHELNCTRIAQTQCGFPLGLQKRRWTIFLRVRAELDRLPSGWVFTGPFVAERNSKCWGCWRRLCLSKEVSLFRVKGRGLGVFVSPGFDAPWRCWGGSGLSLGGVTGETGVSSGSFEQEQEAHKTLLEIGELKESTLYCFSLQVEFKGDFGDLLGQQSAPECHRTAVS
ncbi:INGR2 protein, partial [Mionectes macconnelli]|nr:INGR2 protein [Mionectes macconnelli]